MMKKYDTFAITNGTYTMDGSVQNITYFPNCEKKDDSAVDKFTLATHKGTFEFKIIKHDKIHDELNDFNYMICEITETKEKCIVSPNPLDCRVAYLYLKYKIKK